MESIKFKPTAAMFKPLITAKFTSKEMAEKVGISQAYISLIKRGHRAVRWDVAKAFAELTGTDPSEWMENPALMMNTHLEVIKKRG